MARRWITALVEPPIAPLTRIAFSKAAFVMMSDGFRSSFTICTIRRPVSCEITRRRESTAGIAAFPESAMPSASAMLAMVEAVPMVLQEPGERLIACSASRKSSFDIVPALTASDICQSAVPDPTRSPRNQPFSIGPARDEDRRNVDRGRAHEQRRRGLVAAGEQHDAVERVGAQRLLDVHGAEVAVEHRRRPERALAGREDRELDRQTAGLVDAVAHPLGEVAEMGVARRKL